jgi:fucose 4-O-acetylase-like acetyltransferase
VNRNLSVDVLRGIGILAVVSGHASSGVALYPFTPYSFHMPLFFFLSGMFFSETNVESFVSAIVKNARALLLYSTVFYIFYACVCQVLAFSGFSSFSESFSLRKILFNQFAGSGAYAFTAAYWFIPCLFFVKVYFSVAHARLYSLLSERFDRKVLFLSVFFLIVYLLLGFVAVGYSVSMYESATVSWYQIPFLRFAFALFFYYVGSLFQKYDLQRFLKHIVVLIIIYVVQQQLWGMAGNLDFWMQTSKYQNAYLPIVSSILAIAFFYGLSDVAAKNKSCSNIIGYIGKKSFPILLHHLFGFFLVNAALCLLGVIRPSDVVGPYYQWDTVHTWPLYIFAGVSISLIFDRYLVRPVFGLLKDFFLLGRFFLRERR